ncbi:MAG: tripartite tricarboxylate transporter substrate binding protein [Burkholderiales bacterium]|nr:tripartite tricarboxylate transporter substrate binding protein [Burkholderiales bacterium]
MASIPAGRLQTLPLLPAVFLAASALGQPQSTESKWPARPIRLIIDFPAGGVSDTLARAVGARITEMLGQQVVYDNRPGANGIIAYSLGSKATPDGYTLVWLSTPFPLNAVLRRSLPYDTLKDFAPMSLVADYPNVLVVHPSVAAKSVAEFVAYANKKAGAMTYSSSGNGSVQHLAMELFIGVAKFPAVHVPFVGSAPAVINMVSGQVEGGITAIPSAIAHIRSNRLRALGVASAKRSSQLAEVPTFIESGFNVTADGWGGLAGPAGTPAAIVRRLNAEVIAAVKLAHVQERIVLVGGEPRTSTPEEFAQRVRDDVARWGAVVQRAGIKADG